MASGQTRSRISSARVLQVTEGRGEQRRDRLAGEEPLEIRVALPGKEPRAVAVTMRTPGDDFELAAGFLFTEGLISPGDIARIDYCTSPDVTQQYNVVTVDLKRVVELGPSRNFFTTSSCGICGKASIDAVETECPPISSKLSVSSAVVSVLPGELRSAQRVFDVTGGLHAAGLFDGSGRLVKVKEDVGRHNAFDKLIGKFVLSNEMPLANSIAMVSGRASFEIVQKAAMAGIPVLCAVSAPSSLAVAASARLGVTLVGFLRGSSFNVYTHPGRVSLAE